MLIYKSSYSTGIFILSKNGSYMSRFKHIQVFLLNFGTMLLKNVLKRCVGRGYNCTIKKCLLCT